MASTAIVAAAATAAEGRTLSSTVVPRVDIASATVMTLTLPHPPVLHFGRSSLTQLKHLRFTQVTTVRHKFMSTYRVADGIVHWARARHSSHTKALPVTSHDGSSDHIPIMAMASGKKLAEEGLVPTTLLATLMGIVAAASFAVVSVNVEAADAAEKLGGGLFQRNCAACHSGGGNILQPAATLFNKDLEKNGLATEDDIYKITYFGKNRMPGYGEKCAPRGQCTFGPRLSEEDIRALAEFVKLNANEGWPKR